METVIKRETIYEGRIVNLYVETVQLPDGHTTQREIIRHGGAVAMVPLHEDGRVTLVRQYRLAAGRELLEVPAGTLEPGEDPLACAARELQEEAGLHPGSLTRLGGFFVAPGYSSEYIHVYLATELTPSSRRGDEDEFLEVITVPLDEALALIEQEEIADAKTISALLWAASHLVQRGQP